MKGIVSHIQRMSIHDGPGIRTTVFLKGCNMRCKWCHNPETFSLKPELEWISDSCINCQACIPACPTEALTSRNELLHFDKSQCSNCMQCVEHCYPEALRIVGKEFSANELHKLLLQDKAFFEESKGGITISGGEPFLQTDFVSEIIKNCKSSAIHTVIQTNLSMEWSRYVKVIENTDLIMVDLKLISNEEHKKWTGIGNKTLLKNLVLLDESKVDYIVRTPVIPGINDSEEVLFPIVQFLNQLHRIRAYELLPFHPLANSKYKNLGIHNPLVSTKALKTDRLKVLSKFVDKHFTNSPSYKVVD